MAPLCADPRQIVITFNPARRQALLKLVNDITSYMIAQLESSSDLGEIEPEAPVFCDDNGQNIFPTSENQNARPKPNRRATDEAKRVQEAALIHMHEWKNTFMPKIREIVRVEDDDKIRAERKKRSDAVDKQKPDTSASQGDGDLIDLDDDGGNVQTVDDLFTLQHLYHPIPTRLTTVSIQDRKEALSCILLLILSTGKYSAYSRTLSLYLASALELPQSFVVQEETEIAKSLMESSTADQSQKEAMNAEAEAAKRAQENKVSRFWKVGLASVAGAAVIGITGGLAAPLVAGAIGGIMGGVGLGGVASFLGIFWMNGALVGALFGAYGAKMTGEMMDSYAKEVQDFKFIPLNEEWGQEYQHPSQKQQDRRLRVTIGINGWLKSEDDITRPWRVLPDETEVFALRYEKSTLLALGTALEDLAKSAAWNIFKLEIIKRTVLATLFAALWPITLLSAASNIDNPFSRASNRSKKAGQLLADALINKVQGERPVTLIGYSNGAAAIHSCLKSLAERRGFGLVDTVVIIGAPAPADPSHWRTIRTAVSGKIFNIYSENDMVLGFVYRMHTLSLGVAGLQAIKEVEGIENLNLSDRVSGHLRYAELVGAILNKCGFDGVKGKEEIEEDDVIRAKKDYAEGKLTDVEPRPKEDKVKTKKDVFDDLRGLQMSDIEGTPPPLPRRQTEPANSPLPKRPSKWDTAQPIPRRPVASSSKSDAYAWQPPPPSDRPDDEGYQGISMVNNDSDDEDGNYDFHI